MNETQKNILKEKLINRSIPEPNTGCWLWSGSNTYRYGVIKIPDGNRSQIYAHRASYEVFIGDIPCGMFVCHKCDTPLCINPAHLWLGTHSENIKDSFNKGRQKHIKENYFISLIKYCKSGHHDWIQENIYSYKRNNRIVKSCRMCWNEARRRRLNKEK